MIEIFLASFATFFVVIDPPGIAPMFATLTDHTSRAWQRKMAVKSVVIASIILVGFAFGGPWLLQKLHVSLDSFRIAGGTLLFLIAVDMLFEKRSERREERNEKVLSEARLHPERFEDISVFPMAIPLIAGPGAIASIMLQIGQNAEIGGKMVVLAGAGANLILCLVGFLVAGKITKIMGPTIATMIERVFGIILSALAAQFIVDGIRGAFNL
ncbi:MAG: multiple antibiotic resistance protein [Hyphomonadaceae bacterium]|nr:MAG: multiple antibiotic resistance protein [Hyphomonadaceae bacterium]KAF0185302.1 MAG: multiple antibiotic resistance protein [Hyphomonadaceae bacterium]